MTLSEQLAERFGSVIEPVAVARANCLNPRTATSLQIWQVVRSIEIIPDDASALHWLRVGWSAEVTPVVCGYHDLLDQVQSGNPLARHTAEQIVNASLTRAFTTMARWWLYDRHDSGPVFPENEQELRPRERDTL